uniref:Uncharacterized protein n=1 Tax=Amphimedon queenslandica TaxID=400682 RepID=A0A1X7VS53_AMPQE
MLCGVMDQFGESPEDRILDLYEELKGVEFQGHYLGHREKRSHDGRSVTFHLVEVISEGMKSKMEAIIGCDRGDDVWKGIDRHTFWVSSIDGQSEGNEESKGISCYKLDRLTHGKQVLKWQRKDYSSVISIYLKALPPDSRNH